MWYNILKDKFFTILRNMEEIDLAYLDTEFNNFYDDICIHEESNELRAKRDMLKSDIEKYLPDELKELGIEVNKSDFRFINQGSYAISTTIKNPYGAIDLDYAVIIPIETEQYVDIPQIKKAVKKSLSHVYARTVRIKEPCVTVSYYENDKETIHIDFPIYASDDYGVHLARGKEYSSEENYGWEDADPDGLNSYFKEELNNKTGLRQIVRLIKKWKQEKYKNSTNDNEVPPSVALTILACDNYVEEDHIISSLYETLKNIRDSFIVCQDENGNITSADISCDLPVTPYSDVFYKMRKSSSHLITFYNRLCADINNLNTAISLEDEHEAGKYVQKVLGDWFEVPEKQVEETVAKYNRESSFG
ncbi:MAG: hypothetical protein J1E56_00945 [Ruminococcus sp.]|nr:hypothetical protein [Ruminococcus sp.]